MGFWVAGGLHQFIDDMGGGRGIWVPHAKVDNILAPGPGGGLHGVHFGEDIWGQSLDTVKFKRHGRYRQLHPAAVPPPTSVPRACFMPELPSCCEP